MWKSILIKSLHFKDGYQVLRLCTLSGSGELLEPLFWYMSQTPLVFDLESLVALSWLFHSQGPDQITEDGPDFLKGWVNDHCLLKPMGVFSARISNCMAKSHFFFFFLVLHPGICLCRVLHWSDCPSLRPVATPYPSLLPHINYIVLFCLSCEPRPQQDSLGPGADFPMQLHKVSLLSYIQACRREPYTAPMLWGREKGPKLTVQGLFKRKNHKQGVMCPWHYYIE